jgi:hypothetical protein
VDLPRLSKLSNKKITKIKVKKYAITGFNFEITAVHDSFDIASVHCR